MTEFLADPGTADSRGPYRKGLTNGPLYVIGLFLGITQAGLAYVSGETDGVTQALVLGYLALYTASVTALFFTILWRRNWILYPPSEYGNLKPQDFVSAMQGAEIRAKGLAEHVRQELDDAGSIGRKLTDVANAVPPNQRDTAAALVDEIRSAVVQRIEEAAIVVDPSPLKGHGVPMCEIAYDPRMPVSKLVDHLWWRIQPFPPYPYGTMWALRDTSSDKVLSDIGPAWAQKHGKGEDDRPISEVGIVGGMVLDVVSAKGKS